MARRLVCLGCGAQEHSISKQPLKFCFDCGHRRYRENGNACSKVNYAVAKGVLPRAKTLICVDCGAPATEYDHRDYTKPLEVVPVCRPCNHKRPPAYSSQYRPAHATEHSNTSSER